MKSKKIGLCRREIETKRLFMTDGDLKSAIRSALRKVWSGTSRRIFIEAVRVPYVGPGKYKWAVECTECGTTMGLSQRGHRTLASGKLSKHKRSVYEVDHVHGNPPFTELAGLGPWAENLFNSELRIMCVRCHQLRTDKQRKKA